MAAYMLVVRRWYVVVVGWSWCLTVQIADGEGNGIRVSIDHSVERAMNAANALAVMLGR